MNAAILRQLAESLRLQASILDALAGAANDTAPVNAPELVNAVDYLTQAGCARSRVLHALRNGSLVGRKCGRRWLVSKAECDRWIESTSQKPAKLDVQSKTAPANPVLAAMGFVER